jgi:hypothetical protein
MRTLSLRLLILLISIVFISCAGERSFEPEEGAPVSNVGGQDPSVNLRAHHLVIDSLRFRKADRQFTCEKSDVFLSELKWNGILACLQSAQKDATLSFLVDREAEKPELVLQELPKKSKAPLCVTTTLARIPVPREIFYQSDELSCFASGLAMRQGEVRLDVPLPVTTLLRSEADARQLVLSWVLTLFWSDEQQLFPAKPLTDSLCQECLGEGQVIRSLKPPRALWPAQ